MLQATACMTCLHILAKQQLVIELQGITPTLLARAQILLVQTMVRSEDGGRVGIVQN
jgi:hypothetical protein